MASVNPLSRELVFKIVYYGPGLGGKTTTLEHLHRTAKPEHRGKLVSLATPVDRTLYFDFLPVRLPPIRGMNVRLQLFTVPGQVYFNATRKLVLTGADGIVFVSDSQIARADANLESLENLRENLAEQGRDLAEMPLIFQHNKRDLPDLLSIEQLDEMLNPFTAFSLATSARTGLGIYEGLERISERVLRAFEQRLPEELGGFGASFDAVEGGLVTALRDASPPVPVEPAISRLLIPTASWSSIPPNTTIDDNEVHRAPPPSDDAAQVYSAKTVIPAELATDGPNQATGDGASFAALWQPSDRPLVVEIEAALAASHYAHAALRCAALVERLLAHAADLLGSAQTPRDPAVVPLLLGLDGRRYLSFRSTVLKARAGGDITAREALAAFAFAITARLAEAEI